MIIFKLLLTNESEFTASEVEISSLLPSESSFVLAKAEKGKYNPLTGIWNVGDIEGHSTKSLTILAKVKSDKPFIFESEIINANEIDLDSTPNNDNPKEDDQVSLTINDSNIDTSTSDDDTPLSINSPSDYEISKSNLKNSDTIEEIALSQFLRNTHYEPVLSVKSLGFLNDNYHVELEYKF